MKKVILYAIMVVACGVMMPARAQKNQSYEYQRAYEALIEKNNETEAVEYFTKDLKNNPKNGYSW